MSAEVCDTSDPESLRKGLRAARVALAKKQLVIIPTDTHYAVAVDAFSPAAHEHLGRFKQWEAAPIPQVILPTREALGALADTIHPDVAALTEALWPGPLTVVVPASQTLRWNLGEEVSQVALRLVDHGVVDELLADTGPLAVSAAHPVGDPPDSLEQLLEQAGDQIAVVLTDPKCLWGFDHAGSTLVDASGVDDAGQFTVLREGLISRERLESVTSPGVHWAGP